MLTIWTLGEGRTLWSGAAGVGMAPAVVCAQASIILKTSISSVPATIRQRADQAYLHASGGLPHCSIYIAECVLELGLQKPSLGTLRVMATKGKKQQTQEAPGKLCPIRQHNTVKV